MRILDKIEHQNVVSLYESGFDGEVQSGPDSFSNLTYLVMEYVEGECLFDVAMKLGPLGEENGKAIFSQLLDVMIYLAENQIAHIDLKLENIVVDRKMNIKLLDFGFAQDQHINKLTKYRGTKTYMAPEIRKREEYDGTQADVFSSGVLLFILVVGNFPFTQASLKEQYYNLSQSRDKSKYWKVAAKR